VRNRGETRPALRWPSLPWGRILGATQAWRTPGKKTLKNAGKLIAKVLAS
jgi:hypothetical protein